jgi:hypothetical protein
MFAVNVSIVVVAIGSLIQDVLSSYIYKARLVLFLVVF